MKLYDKKEVLPILLIIIIAVVGAYFYPLLPDQVPTHWGISGEADGWSSKNFTVIFFPVLTAVLYLLLSFFPLLDPMKTNIELFAHQYFWFKNIFVLFLGSLYFLTIYAALGNEVNVGKFVMWGIAALLAFIGWMLPKIKKNYTIGIRLPWTLHSEIVWEKTHRVGGRLFILLAVVLAAVSFLPGVYAFWTLMASMVLMLVTLFIYSYWQYRQLAK